MFNVVNLDVDEKRLKDDQESFFRGAFESFCENLKVSGNLLNFLILVISDRNSTMELTIKSDDATWHEL